MARGLPPPIVRPERGERPLYSAHAVDQMWARGVPPGDVEAVLADPDDVGPGNRPRRVVVHGVARGRAVRVVLVAGSRPPLVVIVVDLGRATR